MHCSVKTRFFSIKTLEKIEITENKQEVDVYRETGYHETFYAGK
jgi:hypothetical protein